MAKRAAKKTACFLTHLLIESRVSDGVGTFFSDEQVAAMTEEEMNTAIEELEEALGELSEELLRRSGMEPG